MREGVCRYLKLSNDDSDVPSSRTAKKSSRDCAALFQDQNGVKRPTRNPLHLFMSASTAHCRGLRFPPPQRIYDWLQK